MEYEREKTLSRAIAERRASPSFDGNPIPDSDLRGILQAGLQSPSGYNLQPWRFIVVRSPDQKKKLRAACWLMVVFTGTNKKKSLQGLQAVCDSAR